MGTYFSSLVLQSLRRSAEATTSVLSIAQPELRAHLTAALQGERGVTESLLAEPVFEQMFGWERAPIQMQELAGQLLSQTLIDKIGRASCRERVELVGVD